MGCGLPVVVSENVGIANVIAENSAGLVKSRDPKTFADGIEYLLEKPDARRLMGERAKVLVEKEFRWPKLARQFKLMYEQVIGENKHRTLK